MGADDSPSLFSAESSFRELDDVFLQSQTRIWLGEVLHARFDEQLSICDLLSDGDILFEVSKELWNMLLVKYMELNHIKAHLFIPVDTRKSSGRYRPYSNVDSFLKVCKILGLSGVDLFSPSDVVEKRDTRKVCICIRSLSKKARAKRLNVPDFDIVTTTVAMPKDVVRCIRRSLELSTCTVTCSQSKDTQLKFRQRSSFATHRRKDGSNLEESDEAKNYCSEMQSYISYTEASGTDGLYLNSGESPYRLNKYAVNEDTLQSRGIDKFEHTLGAPESLLLQCMTNSSQLDRVLSPLSGSELMKCDELTPVNHVLHQISLSDMISFRILSNGPLHIPEDCLCHSCMGAESHSSNTTPNSLDLTSPASSVSSVVGRVLDFDAQTDSEDLRTLVPLSWTKSLEKVSVMNDESQFESNFNSFDLFVESFSPYSDASNSYSSTYQHFDSRDAQISSSQKNWGDSLLSVNSDFADVKNNEPSIESHNVITGVQMVDQKSKLESELDCSGNVVDQTCKDSDDCLAVESSERCQHHIDCRKGFGDVKKEGHQLCINQPDNVHSDTEHGTAIKDERKRNDVDFLAEPNTDGRNDKETIDRQRNPAHIPPLLKTVAKGTALIGLLFLLNLRKRSVMSINGEASSQNHAESTGVRFLTRKAEKGGKIYPVEKFKFMD